MEAGIGRIQSRCPIPYSAATFCSTSFSVESVWRCWLRRKSPSVWMRRFTEAAMASARSWSMNSSAPVNVARMAHSTSTLLRQHLEMVSQRSRSIRPCRPITFRIPGQQPVIGRYGSSRGGCLFPIRQDSNPSPPTRITNQQHGKSRHNTSCEHKNVSVRIFPISFRVPPPPRPVRICLTAGTEAKTPFA